MLCLNYITKANYDKIASTDPAVLTTLGATLWTDPSLDSHPEDFHPDGTYDEKRGVAIRQEKLAKAAAKGEKGAKKTA